jgi:LuxR family maltose regulon positive regulatory protein
MSAANPTQAAEAGLAAVPAVGSGMVCRDGLLARLGAAARVTQISAPAGSGKTSLLRSWIGAAGLADRAAWVCAQGRDEQRFWTAVADALRDTSVGAPLVRGVTAGP